MEPKTRLLAKRMLALEGKDECNFFQALLKHLKIESIQVTPNEDKLDKNPDVSFSKTTVQLIDIGGKDRFKEAFEALTILEGFDAIQVFGFIRDAEANPADSAFASICNSIKNYLPVPAEPGKINKDDRPIVGIFIMPDNAGIGMLENLCLKTIEMLPQYACVDAFVSCLSQHLPPEEKAAFNEPKSRVLSYLATRAPIAHSLGVAALKGFWDFENHSLNNLNAFLNDLFPAQGS